MSATSSANALISSAKVDSLMRSLASGPTMATPSNWLSSASMITLMNPSVSLTAIARPKAENGYLPIFTLLPCDFACVSVRPTVAISGSVKTTAGMPRASWAALCPAITSAATSPSFIALCAR